MTTLQEMVDDRDIRHGLARFARLLDTKDWAHLSDVFAEDIAFDYGAAGEEKGMEALRHNMRKHLDVCGPSQHLLGSIVITIDGDTAISRSYVQARHVGVGDKAHAIFDSNGEYTDRWARRPEGWRIVRRDAKWFAHYGDPGVIGIGVDGLG